MVRKNVFAWTLAVAALLLPAHSFSQPPSPQASASPAVAQSGGGEWIEFEDRSEFFSVNFPGQPAVTTTTWQPQRGKPLSGRVYTVQDGPRRYSVKVVRLVGLPEISDVKGSIAWEAWSFRKRGGEITYDAYAQVDRIEGHQLHIANPDKSLSFVGIYLHGGRLYTLEATVPPDSPGAVHFQQSLSILDENGIRIRYELDAEGNRARRIGEYGPLEGR